jgi:protein-tyrosine phosphatase
MFEFFRKQHKTDKVIYPDLSFIYTDVHSHFIPGIDDGAKDMETSLELIRGLVSMGYRNVITTPHVKMESFSNTTGIILNGLNELQYAVQQNGIPVNVYAAAEYFLDEHFERLLQQRDLLCISGNQVLVEISFLAPPFNLNELLLDIQAKGYQPVLAHPERYGYYHLQFEQYYHFRELGCKLQLNMNSLTGYYGKHVKTVANKLLDEKLIDYLGSDMHSEKHLRAIQSLVHSREALQKISEYPFLNKQLV